MLFSYTVCTIYNQFLNILAEETKIELKLDYFWQKDMNFWVLAHPEEGDRLQKDNPNSG